MWDWFKGCFLKKNEPELPKMDLKIFTKTVLKDLVGAVEESSKELNREILIGKNEHNKSVEFDIAVTAEKSNNNTEGLAIKVLSFGSEEVSKQTVLNRIKFGLFVSSESFEQQKARREKEKFN